MMIGHEENRIYLEGIIKNYENGGFLLVGPEGIGKLSLIKEILQDNKDFEKIIFEGKNKYIAREFAGKIRNLALLRVNKKRIIIINDAHRFTKEAQNLLLKILEETPSKTLFFFITHKPNKILLTLSSRLYKLKFSLLEKELILRYLEKQGYSSKKVEAVYNLYPGQMGLILRLLQEENKFKTIIQFLKEKSTFERLNLAEKISDTLDLNEFLSYLLIFERQRLKNTPAKNILLRIKRLLALYFDSVDYNLNKKIQISEICLSYE